MPEIQNITIDLMRHGETTGGPCFRGSLDTPLSAAGLTSMQQRVSTLPGWDLILTSPLKRCVQFATALSEQRNIQLDIEPQLKEIHFGDWEGKSAADLMVSDPQRLKDFWADPVCHTPPNGESMNSFNARLTNFWQGTLCSHITSNNHILIVSHGGVIRTLLANLLEIPLKSILNMEIGLATISRLTICKPSSQAPDHVTLQSLAS